MILWVLNSLGCVPTPGFVGKNLEIIDVSWLAPSAKAWARDGVLGGDINVLLEKP
jgi:hypothetical protein